MNCKICNNWICDWDRYCSQCGTLKHALIKIQQVSNTGIFTIYDNRHIDNLE